MDSELCCTYRIGSAHLSGVSFKWVFLIVAGGYLKQFRVKLESRKSYAEKLSISVSGSQRERTVALKELVTLKKQLEEITTYENKLIFPLATQQIEIDLDDGGKANYPKFGEALEPIKGL
ncbi:MAG: hypothetical protein NTZ74_12005 [Chloroflexi bacterium]|nr:hypothetical protein [Chloroflexota bacterium]